MSRAVMGNPRFSSSTPSRAPVVDRYWLPLEPIGPRRGGPSNPGLNAVSAQVRLIRKEWGYYAQGFEMTTVYSRRTCFRSGFGADLLHRAGLSRRLGSWLLHAFS